MTRLPVDVVVPTVGRPSLARLLEALAGGEGPAVGTVLIVADRPLPQTPPGAAALARVAREVRVVPGRAAGPAAARNTGWRLATAPWVAFLDDDVVPERAWRARLALDLGDLPAEVVATQGRIVVPRPHGRRPTDWERNVAGLETARWATADMAYRRSALSELGGFDERFRRAYREDADLALRATARGGRLVRGRRRVDHPVGPAGPWISLRAQAGNADDVLMDAIHGPGWRARAGAPRGRRRRHLATAAAAATAAGALATGRRRAAAGAGALWLAATAELAWARVAPGPRTGREVGLMALTSVAMPFAAAGHAALGLARRRRMLADRVRAPATPPFGRRPEAILLDRDGTLVADVPYNGDPGRVTPMPGAPEAIARVRDAGVRMGVVSNQSGIARGLISADQVAAVNRRVVSLLGDVGPWMVCPHGADEGCGCRKPEPGLVLGAAEALGVEPSACVVVGDIGADVEAARRAGARAVLVPTARTLPDEIAAAPAVAPDLVAAVEMILGPPS